MDVKFEVQDLFEKLRPNAKVHETLEEAAETLNEIVARQAKVTGALENVGQGSDEVSEEEQEDQQDPLDDEEPEEDEEKPEDTEVVSCSVCLKYQVDTVEPPEEDEEEEVVLFNRNVEPE